jgi:hypothetical protein
MRSAHVAQDKVSAADKRFTGRRQCHAAPLAFKQSRTEFVLKLVNAARERRLRKPERARSPS